MKKKWLIFISLLVMGFIVSACSSTEGQKLEEIYANATEASENLDSLAMTIESEQTFEVEGEDGSGETNSPLPTDVPIQSTIESEMQMDPVAFHQTIETMGQSMEQYYTEEGFYMTSPMEDGWMKAPKELLDQMNAISAQQQTPASQLETLKDYVDEFNLETEGSNYILSFSSKGENVQKLIEDSIEETMPEGMFSEEMMAGVEVNELSYRFAIDKDSYYPQNMNMDMSMTVEENGESITIQQSMYGEYSRFNEIEEITIPEEVTETAKEMPDIEG